MKFANFTLEKISPKYYQLLFNYYNGNKNHLELWEPTRIDNYYTLEFHINRTDERMGIMYEAVVSSNNYMFTQYPICQINAGVITRNKRSIKLINRLFFKPTGNFQKMEINRKVEQLEIYNLIKPDK